MITELESYLTDMLRQLKDKRHLYHRAAEDVIFHSFMANYRRSGLKMRTGKALTAISGPDAPGAIFRVDGNVLTCGIDYAAVPYMKWQIEGVDHPWVIRARRKNMLSFVINGQRIFARSVKHPGLKPHDIINLSDHDAQRAVAVMAAELGMMQ